MRLTSSGGEQFKNSLVVVFGGGVAVDLDACRGWKERTENNTNSINGHVALEASRSHGDQKKERRMERVLNTNCNWKRTKASIVITEDFGRCR